jgi:RHS repeat-associated protein
VAINTAPESGAGGTAQNREGWLFAPPATFSPVHDPDGNLVEDARWVYTWDAENRLIGMQEKVIPVAAGLDPTTEPKRLKLEFAYDARHRRIAKVVKEWEGDPVGGAFAVVKDRRYVYDGWNMIAESSRGTEARWTDGAAGCSVGVRARAERPNQLDHTTATGTGLAGASVVRTQVWGQDLSGTMQGAGGVGGLLAVRHEGQTYVPLMDGNGNVMGLQGLGGAKDGQTVARYDYDAFGNRITNTAPELGEDVNPFGFSTKFTDEETGLVYYGYRYYAPEVGRWVSRDPIGEKGGINLYGMVGNDAVNRVDVLGLKRLPVILSGGFAKKVMHLEGTGTSALGIVAYSGDGYWVKYYNWEDACPSGSVRLVQALHQRGIQGGDPFMDALPAQDNANATTSGGIPYPAYRGNANPNDPVTDAPGGNGGAFGHLVSNVEICALCTCSITGTEAILGCTTFTWSTKTKIISNWSGPSPKPPTDLWLSAAQAWDKSGAP